MLKVKVLFGLTTSETVNFSDRQLIKTSRSHLAELLLDNFKFF